MRALGINAGDVTRARRDHRGPLTAKKLVKIKTGDWELHAHSIERCPSRPSRQSRPKSRIPTLIPMNKLERRLTT